MLPSSFALFLQNALADVLSPPEKNDKEAAISTGDAVAATEEPDNESANEDSHNLADVASDDEVQVGASVDHSMKEGCDGGAEDDFTVSSIPEKRKT